MDYTGDLPPYVIPGSAEEAYWRKRNPNGHSIVASREFATGSTEAHRFANTGNIFSLRKLLDEQEDIVNVRDANGWTPLHEAVRKGDFKAVTLLLERGAEVNARTGMDGDGGGPLDWAAHYHGDNHDIIDFLKQHGARSFETEQAEL
jgi:ankyrin repeat protein